MRISSITSLDTEGRHSLDARSAPSRIGHAYPLPCVPLARISLTSASWFFLTAKNGLPARRRNSQGSNGLFLLAQPELWRWRELSGPSCSYQGLGDRHARFSSLVPLIPALLASGPFGSDCLPVHLALAFTDSLTTKRPSCPRTASMPKSPTLLQRPPSLQCQSESGHLPQLFGKLLSCCSTCIGRILLAELFPLPLITGCCSPTIDFCSGSDSAPPRSLGSGKRTIACEGGS